jgi:hypothetical protein
LVIVFSFSKVFVVIPHTSGYSITIKTVILILFHFIDLVLEETARSKSYKGQGRSTLALDVVILCSRPCCDRCRVAAMDNFLALAGAVAVLAAIAALAAVARAATQAGVCDRRPRSSGGCRRRRGVKAMCELLASGQAEHTRSTSGSVGHASDPAAHDRPSAEAQRAARGDGAHKSITELAQSIGELLAGDLARRGALQQQARGAFGQAAQRSSPTHCRKTPVRSSPLANGKRPDCAVFHRTAVRW